MSVRRISLLIIVMCVLGCGMLVSGINCSNSNDCSPFQICSNASCECIDGYVKYIEKCFPLRKHGQECNHDIQCAENGMICTNEDNDVQQRMFCLCDLYSLWNESMNGCVEIEHVINIAGHFRQMHNVTGKLEKSAEKVFLGVVIAGLTSVSVLLSCIGLYSVYGCCEKPERGSYGEIYPKNVQLTDAAVTELPPGSYDAMDADFGDI